MGDIPDVALHEIIAASSSVEDLMRQLKTNKSAFDEGIQVEPRFKGLWPCVGIFAQAECKPIPSGRYSL